MVTDLTGDDISEIVILKRRGFVILGVPERIGDETKGGILSSLWLLSLSEGGV